MDSTDRNHRIVFAVFILFLSCFFILQSCKKENELPECKITSPVQGTIFNNGDEIIISADAADPDGSIAEVRFYADNIGLAAVTSFPYTAIWSTAGKNAGNYTIKVTALDDLGDQSSDEVVITLAPEINLPVAAFSATPTTGNLPLEINFQNESELFDSLLWDFGDGTTSEETDPIHIYEVEGVFDVSLTAYNEDGEDVEVKEEFITVYNPCPSVTDIDGNTYATILIGEQCWMAENLKVTRFPNGEMVLFFDENTLWVYLEDNLTDDGYCFYDNNTAGEYGALYTYAAAIGDNWERDNEEGQGLCPDGWHLPAKDEWDVLTEFLGGTTIAGGKMKEAGYEHWYEPNTGATNESGFTGLPGGYRSDSNGSFNDMRFSGFWWTATEYTNTRAWITGVIESSASILSGDIENSTGLSVRCVKN